MSNATHEQLLQVVYAEWAVAILLTVSAVVCFVRNRRASFLFLPWLGIAFVAALHGTFFLQGRQCDERDADQFRHRLRSLCWCAGRNNSHASAAIHQQSPRPTLSEGKSV